MSTVNGWIAGVGLGLALTVSGCVADRMTPERAAAMRTNNEANLALARAHKITYAEAAVRTNADMESVAPGPLAKQQKALDDYRLMLAGEVDAGRMKPQTAEAKQQQKAVELLAQR
ncbi:hypothetical protein [Lichenihabitans psoromatis]|uniref:hypothetical protein n=1 Tax=Lichenihabitans psoromatis TaxID=2528642 RepID=UPI00103852C7|nr:hypothetical protein [Lichenihabitans psoromatis]